MLNTYCEHIKIFSRNARLFLLAMVVLAFGTAAQSIFYNLFLEAVGFDRAFIGYVNTAIQIGGAVMAFPAIFLLHRIGRKRAIFLALLIGLVSWSISLFTLRREFILALQAINGFGTVLFGLAVVPMLAESSTQRERTTLFSVQEGLTTLSLFFGSVLFGSAPSWLAHLFAVDAESVAAYRTVLVLSACIRGLGLLPFLFLEEQHAEPQNHNPSPAPVSPHHSLIHHFHPRALLKLQTPILLFAVPYFLVYFGGSLIFPFLSLLLKERFRATDSEIGLVLGLVNLSIGVGAMLAPLLVTRFGRTRLVIAGAFVSAAALWWIGLVATLLVVAILVVLRAGLFNLTLPLYKAYVIDHTPPREYTIITLLLALSANIPPAIAPSLSGNLQNQSGFAVVLPLAATLYACAGLAYALAFWRTRRPVATDG